MKVYSKVAMGLGALALGVALGSVSVFAQDAPLSPGGISTGASNFGGPGPGYIGPRGPVAVEHNARQVGTKPLYNSVSSTASPQTVSTTGARLAPLSPGGIGTGASSFGGPGYNQ